MQSIHRHPLFYSVLCLLGVTTLAAAWRLRSSLRQVHSSQYRLDQKRAELQSLIVRDRATEAEELHNRLGKAEAVVAEHELALSNSADSSSIAAPLPTNSTDAFFDLAVFAERMRTRAAQFRVRLKPDEKFGFAEYTSKGPDNASIGMISQQRVALEVLLGKLFAASPRELISVHRCRRATAQSAPGDEAPRGRNSPREGNDFFDPDERLSVRVPGVVETQAFQLSFIGGTGSLRLFLNSLATCERPFSTRSVNAAPTRHHREPDTKASDASADSIFVQPSDRVFTVTVESLELVKSPTSS